MVSTTVSENGVDNGKPDGLPAGDYCVIGWDLDTTGRRLIDEICQIAAYCPSASFSQYVMPFRELNPAARRRHNIRVTTIGRYRMLKDTKTGNILKTKSEISALTDFVQWLETVRGKSANGIILISHEPRKIIAPLLLESLRKYNLVEKFSSIVTGFANGYALAGEKCAKTVQAFSLRVLSRVLLDKEKELDSAADRAKLAYEIAHNLCTPEDRPENTQGSGDGIDAVNASLVETVRHFAQPIAKEEEELAALKSVMEWQNSLRPVFAPILRGGDRREVDRRERQRASNLRRLLAESGVNYELLTSTYDKEGNDGIKQLLLSKLKHAKPKEREELFAILTDHFNPENKHNADAVPSNKKQGDTSGSSTPDTATSSPVKAPSSSGETNPMGSPQSTAVSPQREAPSEEIKLNPASEPAAS